MISGFCIFSIPWLFFSVKPSGNLMTGELRKLHIRTAMMLLANSLLYDIISPTADRENDSFLTVES